LRRPQRGPGTRVVHAGLPAPAQGEPFLPGPTFAAPFHLAGDPDGAEYDYHRYGNPTWTHYERGLAELEGAPTLVFASGMAGMAAILVGLLAPGDVLVAPSDAYPGVRDIAREDLAPRGVETRFVATDADEIRAALPGAKVVWIETPSNPGLSVLDIAALADEVHAAGALLCVDNTIATPLAQQPLALGADVSFCSGSKMLTGHSDLILGAVAARDPAHLDVMRAWRSRNGAIPGPFEVWLAHRSLATLDVRSQRQAANAQALAEALAAHPAARDVHYPGLRSHPNHDIAMRQMDGRCGPVIGFTLADAQTATQFLTSSALIVEATSFGGAHTTAERRARWCTDLVPEGFIRLSAGLEDTDDLVSDLTRALDRAGMRAA
jgi:cystathionine gamma-lyase